MRVQRDKLIIVLGLTLAMAGATQAAMPTGSFLRKPARTTSALVQQVRTDRIVADRFMRHFHMSKAEVVDYFSTLHPSKLSSSGAYTVYNVHSDGIIRARVFNLPKGTTIFADSSGRPILKMSCGNPMVVEVPPITNTPQVGVPLAVRPIAVAAETEPVVGTEMLEPPVGEVPTVIEPIRSEPIIPNQVTGNVAPSSGFSVLPLLLIGALGTVRFDGDDCECPPIPEPATMVILGAGAVAVAARKRRKRA